MVLTFASVDKLNPVKWTFKWQIFGGTFIMPFVFQHYKKGIRVFVKFWLCELWDKWKGKGHNFVTFLLFHFLSLSFLNINFLAYYMDKISPLTNHHFIIQYLRIYLNHSEGLVRGRFVVLKLPQPIPCFLWIRTDLLKQDLHNWFHYIKEFLTTTSLIISTVEPINTTTVWP